MFGPQRHRRRRRARLGRLGGGLELGRELRGRGLGALLRGAELGGEVRDHLGLGSRSRVCRRSAGGPTSTKRLPQKGFTARATTGQPDRSVLIWAEGNLAVRTWTSLSHTLPTDNSHMPCQNRPFTPVPEALPTERWLPPAA